MHWYVFSRVASLAFGVIGPMMTSSNWNIFRVTGHLCAGNSPVTGEFPVERPVTRSFDDFFDLCLNKRLSKQSWGWWFETLPRPLWRHCNVNDCCNDWHNQENDIWITFREIYSIYIYGFCCGFCRVTRTIAVTMLQCTLDFSWYFFPKNSETTSHSS